MNISEQNIELWREYCDSLKKHNKKVCEIAENARKEVYEANIDYRKKVQLEDCEAYRQKLEKWIKLPFYKKLFKKKPKFKETLIYSYMLHDPFRYGSFVLKQKQKHSEVGFYNWLAHDKTFDKIRKLKFSK